MGALFSRNKNDGKKRRFKFWASSHDQISSTKAKGVNSSMSISKSQPITPQHRHQQWTEVALSPPSSVLDNIEKDIVADAVPIPPPRKHKTKSLKSTPVFEKVRIERSFKVEAVDSGTPTNLIPVEEAIIIPKKEPIHICDGTHHHVRNIVNGKIIHDTIIVNKKEEEVLSAKHKPIQFTPTIKEEKDKVGVRPKNLSTVSLPNFDELNTKGTHHHHHKTHGFKDFKKKPKRHISVVSLPTHNKTTLSDATVARLENYMARCKSFGALPPKELLEKLQSQLDFSSDSEESWEGVDDWDLEIIDHSGVQQSPVTPRSFLPWSDKITTHHTTITSTVPVTTSSDVTTRNSTITTTVTTNMHTTQPYHHTHSDVRVPTTIEEDLDDIEDDPVEIVDVPPGIITLKKREGRRESIDDFFDSSAENPLVRSVKIKPVNSLGRRGSDGFFGYNKPNISGKSASYFSKSFLESESDHTAKLAQRRKSAGAALHRIDTSDYNDEDDDEDTELLKVEDSTISEDTSENEEKTDSKRDSLNDNDDFVVVHKDGHKTEIVTKTEPVEHSNLLKFLKGNTIIDAPIENKEK